MQAKDIMTREIITVSPTMTIRSLAMTLIKNQISGAPVAGKNGKIVGVVSEADIVAKKGKDVKAIMSKKIISVGDGVWDVRTAANLEMPFLGIGDEKTAVKLRQAGANIVLENYADYDLFLSSLENADVPALR